MNSTHTTTLPNGLRVVTVPLPHLHSAEMALYLGVGSRHDPPGRAGLAHFLEHLVFRGTADFADSTALERAFEALGGMVNAATDAETTFFHSRLHPRHLHEGASLFASMLLRPLLREVETERRIILEEALEELNQQGEEINPDNLTSRLLWPGHPLSLPTIGTRETLTAIRRADLVAHHASRYAPSRTVLVVAGPVSPDEVLAAARAAFDRWQGSAPALAPDPLPAPVRGPALIWQDEPDSQVTVQLAFPLAGRSSPDLIPLRLLRRVLGGSGTSRLMLRLREELGLTYNVEANLSLYADTGVFSVDLAVAPENLVAAAGEIVAVLADMARHPIPEAELAAVCRAYRYDLEFSCDQPDALAARYGWGELVGLVRSVEDDCRALGQVDAAQLRELAQRVFCARNLCAAFVGPVAATDRERVAACLGGL